VNQRRGGQRPTFERAIHFYRADIGLDAAGAVQVWDPLPTLQHTSRLPFTPAGRYQEIEDGAVFWLNVVREGRPQQAVLVTVRRNALPLIEARGQFTDLAIPIGAGLAEQTHAIFYPNGVVGVEFNFYGPRIARFGWYAMAKFRDLYPQPITFQPLLRQDVRDRLARLRDIRVLELSVRRGYAGVLAQANRDIFSGLDALGGASGADEIEVVLKPRRYSRVERLAGGLLQAVRQVANRPDIRENASRFRVQGTSVEGRSEWIDVLSDQLIARKRIVKHAPNSRALESASAFGAIDETYRELIEQIEPAARM
jgi:hypothetical protein